MNKKNSRTRLWAVAICGALLLLPVATSVLCGDTEGAAADLYRYNPQGKPDPFKPFIEIVEKGATAVPLSPLRRFSVEEFRLMGIVRTFHKEIAIVQAPGGKWYTLRRGTRIGSNEGRVAEIRSDSVVVSEKIQDSSGTIRTGQVILVLKKDGENP
ncbi:MAG: pilus assembly protein PilP [Deltaproteobacteria bacterium]|nr:pilus assembly protein PilP [Deltaproteobacteria bacterium]